MTFDRTLLPDAVAYYESEGLRLIGPSKAKWRTTECKFHGGSDSLRINTQTGAFVCMACCGARGGDVLAYHMASHGIDFINAAKQLGAWIDDGKSPVYRKATALSPRAALEVLGFESTLVAVAASNMAKGLKISEADQSRLLTCASRINRIVGDFI